MNYFVKANPNRCIGCRTCLISCVVSHEGKRIFEIDPDGYAFNPKLFMVKTATVSAPIQCKHCESPACKSVCTAGAIKIEDHAVIIDRKKCIGCKSCVVACPFGAVEIIDTQELQVDGTTKKIANKCDLCTGITGGPACTRVCPTDALELVTEDQLEASIEEKRKNSIIF